VDFHKIKSRETLNRSRDDLNTPENHMGLTENFSASTKAFRVNAGILIFYFLFLTALGQNHVY
jgi:hypothetical protein